MCARATAFVLEIDSLRLENLLALGARVLLPLQQQEVTKYGPSPYPPVFERSFFSPPLTSQPQKTREIATERRGSAPIRKRRCVFLCYDRFRPIKLARSSSCRPRYMISGFAPRGPRRPRDFRIAPSRNSNHSNSTCYLPPPVSAPRRLSRANHPAGVLGWRLDNVRPGRRLSYIAGDRAVCVR